MVSAVHAVSAVACMAALSRSSGMASAAPPKGNCAAPWDRDREACKGRKHGRTRLQPHEALPQGRHPPRQARRGLSRRPRLILIIIYLKNAAKNPTSVNIGEKPVISHRQFPSFPVVAAAGYVGYDSLLWFWIVRNVCRFLPVCTS